MHYQKIEQPKEFSAVIAAILTFITLGFFGIYLVYRWSDNIDQMMGKRHINPVTMSVVAGLLMLLSWMSYFCSANFGLICDAAYWLILVYLVVVVWNNFVAYNPSSGVKWTAFGIFLIIAWFLFCYIVTLTPGEVESDGEEWSPVLIWTLRLLLIFLPIAVIHGIIQNLFNVGIQRSRTGYRGGQKYALWKLAVPAVAVAAGIMVLLSLGCSAGGEAASDTHTSPTRLDSYRTAGGLRALRSLWLLIAPVLIAICGAVRKLFGKNNDKKDD